LPHIQAVTIAGRTIEVEKYYSSRYHKKGIVRGDKVKPTTEQQKACNKRKAEKKLRRILNANYGTGDYHIVLDYIRHKGEPDRTRDQMRQDIAIFWREMRKQYKAAGIELKYVHVMEIGKKGARHHHIVVPKISTDIIQQCWYKANEQHNRIKVFPLDDTGNYADLAAYLIKYTDKTVGTDTEDELQGKRWNGSKNLIHPEPKIEIIKESDWMKAEARPLKGYYVVKDSISKGINSPDYYGYGYFRYTMVRLKS